MGQVLAVGQVRAAKGEGAAAVKVVAAARADPADREPRGKAHQNSYRLEVETQSNEH